MSDQAGLKQLQEQQQKQADLVRKLKADKAPKDQVDAAVAELNKIKAAVEKKSKELNPEKVDFPREKFSRVMTQRFFVTPSFEIYGGVAGLYDLGPPATAIKANILNIWRQHFVLHENMLEVDCSSVTPYQVFKASGHVAKFADLMVKDTVTGACYRADHLLEHHLDELLKDKKLTAQQSEELKIVQATCGEYGPEQMEKALRKYNVKAPDTKNDITAPEYFNLMFKTNIGPVGSNVGFLRPETAQGIFVNFKRLLEYNGNQLPFAGAQIGQAFRNEISPRSGLLRVREFTLAEVEHFVNPEDKRHPRFKEVAHLTLNLLPREQQTTNQPPVQMNLGEAVKQKIIANETLGYFVGRTFLFLLRVGVKNDRLRFRQHLQNEMAHYATDCWDAEIRNSYGWVESVGIADRSCYDLQQHSGESGVPLLAFVDFEDGPREVELTSMKIHRDVIGKTAGKDAKAITGYLEKLNEEQTSQLEKNLQKGSTKVTINNQDYVIDAKYASFTREKKKVSGKNIQPGVIEPSFGIGRILYSVLEHNYYVREDDDQKAVFSFPAAIAPVKVSVFPLLSNDEKLCALIPKLTADLNHLGISFKVDTTGQSIGKRYARTDEIGIPYAFTIDKQTLEDSTITVRERDSLSQIRVSLSDAASLIAALVDGRVQWKDAATYRASSSTSTSSSSSLDSFERRAVEAEQQLQKLAARIAELEKSHK